MMKVILQILLENQNSQTYWEAWFFFGAALMALLAMNVVSKKRF